MRTTPTSLLICLSFSRENGDPFLRTAHHISRSPDTLPKTNTSHLSPQKETHLLTPVFQVLYLSTSLHFWGSKKQTSNQAVGEKIYSSSTATLGFSEWFTMVGKSVWRVSGNEKKTRTAPPNANPHPPRNKAIRRWRWFFGPSIRPAISWEASSFSATFGDVSFEYITWPFLFGQSFGSRVFDPSLV